ncbi:MAG: hypothetical protein ACO1NM_06070 [Sphingobium phenoxybenzoativorans]
MISTSVILGKTAGKARPSSIIRRLKSLLIPSASRDRTIGPKPSPRCHYCGKSESPSASAADRCDCDTSTAPW